MTLDDLKLYLRIDGDDEDALLQSLIIAADAFITNAVGADVDKTSELYQMAMKLLIAHWYENRAIVGNADAIAFSLESILMQLRYCGGGAS